MYSNSSAATAPALTTEAAARWRPSLPATEIKSDKENQKASRKKTRKKTRQGVLRGVNDDNILTPDVTQHTTELDGHDSGRTSGPGQRHKYGTRTAKHGRSEDIYDKYDMKYHPADAQLRPKRAAKRRSGSRSLSVSTLPGENEDTEEDSLPSSARDDNSEQASEAEEPDIDEPSPERELDPRASRHSKRTAAQKYVNYSAKHHKDDHSIPGFQHKAKKLKQFIPLLEDGDTSRRNVTTKKERASKSRNTKKSPVFSNQGSKEVNDLVEETLLNLSQIPTPSIRSAAKGTAQHELISAKDGASSNPTKEPTGNVNSAKNRSLPESTAGDNNYPNFEVVSNNILSSTSSVEIDTLVSESPGHGDLSAVRRSVFEVVEMTAQEILNSIFDDVVPSNSGVDISGDIDGFDDLSSTTTLSGEAPEAGENEGPGEICESHEIRGPNETREPNETGESRETRNASIQALLQSNDMISSQRTVADSSSSEEEL